MDGEILNPKALILPTLNELDLETIDISTIETAFIALSLDGNAILFKTEAGVEAVSI